MTDPLDDLRAAFTKATPQPDAAKKAATLARAEEIFAARQGSPTQPRPISDRPMTGAGLIKGIGQMLATLTARPVLTATTALVAVGLVILVPVLRDGPLTRPTLTKTETAPTAPTSAPRERVESFESEAAVDMVMEDAAPPPAAAPVSVPAPESYIITAPTAPMAKLGRQAAGDAVMGIVAPPPAPYPDQPRLEPQTTEEFANAPANPVIVTSQSPVSTFSIDVDTASYAVIRSSLMHGQLPPPEAVRIEEMINYFPYTYPAPSATEAPFKPTVTVTGTPWNADTQLLQIALQGRLPAVADRPPLNLVFLIDTSGSMDQPDKLPLLKQSFRLMLGQLRPEDQVAIVAYAGSAGRVLDATPASDRTVILAALERLAAGGSTAGQEGLQLAYTTAEAMTADGEVTRVILATDGDFNVGIADPERLKSFIAAKRDSGTYLSVLGFGRGNLDDATMQALAQTGNGQAAYIDTLSEAQKVLVDQLTGALFPIANDVKIQVEFNPATIAEYRLIGYETRALRREDFNNDKVDAGEIGAGHSVTALYEITPVGSPAVLNDPLRFGTPTQTAATSDDLAFLRLRYKEPGAQTSTLVETPIASNAGTATPDSNFAAAIAGFGQLLKSGDYIGDWTYTDAIALAEANLGDDRFGYRREAVTLMRLAQSLSQ